MTEVRLSQIRKSFGAVEIFRDLSLTVPAGSFTVLVGPSGCGKSTLLRMIAGLEMPNSGGIEIGGRDVTEAEPSDRGISMVFQSYALFPHMTVAQNIDFGLRLAKVAAPERKRRVAQAAQILDLERYLDRKPAALSGGQRQRVAIGRSIVRNPDVFLFDEPLSNLDAALRNQMRVELAELHQRLKTTMIYVTHDQVEAMTLADQIVVMNAGRIEQVGTPSALYERPATTFVARFIGSPRMNLLDGPLAQEQGAATCGIRPEHLHLSEDGPWQGRVTVAEYLGNETVIHVASEVGDLIVRQGGQANLGAGTPVRLTPETDRLHRFDSAGLRL
ncbi:glycerol-3-phosphate ABC transporter ATPase [Thioclava dalianensis]|uniref:Glycerol-3-phosphate ABC transporter ATPase n=1 Tax=Thioclava dalianensis TaxID=1185766 RepID=A0A074T987_9RHOB|nr:ABC transporter ATP-binding protein [Thioclava dalianensis]KEP68351.1 glycerol-3-phosphate ABC transporter ATPase [Thioclava dalianensis]SFM73871.1 multiple sugar transport system ATP-binding protein [Thioclava dalianensis]